MQFRLTQTIRVPGIPSHVVRGLNRLSEQVSLRIQFEVKRPMFATWDHYRLCLQLYLERAADDSYVPWDSTDATELFSDSFIDDLHDVFSDQNYVAQFDNVSALVALANAYAEELRHLLPRLQIVVPTMDDMAAAWRISADSTAHCVLEPTRRAAIRDASGNMVHLVPGTKVLLSKLCVGAGAPGTLREILPTGEYVFDFPDQPFTPYSYREGDLQYFIVKAPPAPEMYEPMVAAVSGSDDKK